MIFSKIKDPRLIAVRRGGTLSDTDHHLLAIWAADCAQHVLHFFEQVQPNDDRPCQAIAMARAWARGESPMMQTRAAGGHAMGAARALKGAAREAAFAAGQAAVVAHVAAHELGAAAYAIGPCRRPRSGPGRGGSPRVPMAARTASRRHPCPRVGRSAPTQ